jgi:DDE superfamily endonuclease
VGPSHVLHRSINRSIFATILTLWASLVLASQATAAMAGLTDAQTYPPPTSGPYAYQTFTPNHPDFLDLGESYVSYNAEHGTAMILRQVKLLNNIIEQDHRGVKRVTRPMLGFKSFDAAQGTLAGIELTHMLKKGQLVGEDGAESLTPVEQFYTLAA